MILLSWNINGLRAAYKKGFLTWLQKTRPDILCLQETKSSENQLPQDLLCAEGYHVFFSSAERKGYSGVGLYSSLKPGSVRNGWGDDAFDNEGRVQIADYGRFLLCNVYFPNGKASAERLAYKMAFYDSFLKWAAREVGLGKRVILCGDVNTAHREIDLARPKENEKISGFLPEERAWIDRFISRGFFDSFRLFHPDQKGQYTWWDLKSRARQRNVGWRIDYFFVSDLVRPQVGSAFILPDVEGSDHCPVGIELHDPIPPASGFIPKSKRVG
ncbi:MAG TPA: exodeoxyribonuclease III [bacterium]